MFAKVFVVVLLLIAAAGYFFFLGDDQRQQIQKEVRAEAYHARYETMKKTGAFPVLNNLEAARQCRENLQRIELAKRAVCEQRGIAAGTVPLDAILQQMRLKALPRCPQGGAYTIGPVGYPVRCGIASNGTTRTEDDHVLENL
jgi:hypothetical protein